MLRPVFTEKLTESLLQGGWINLVSPHGQGRRRTLSDLRQQLPASLPIVTVDLMREPDRLAASLSACAAIHTPALLIIHNFDLLQEPSLLTQLQSFKQIRGLSLLITTEAKTMDIALDTVDLLLPPLSEAEVCDELQRRGISAKQSIINLIIQSDAPYTEIERAEAP